MANTGLADVVVYDDELKKPTEPEMALSEETKTETNKKIIAEQAKADLLQQAIDTDIGADNSNTTTVSGVPLKDKYNRTETMPERTLDTWLARKKAAIDADLKRLRDKYLTIVDINIQDTKTKQKELMSYGTLINSAARTARSYLAGLKTSRRRKAAGRKGGQPAGQVAS